MIIEESYLKHYGILRKSGRYPWGSGNNPHQRSKDFYTTVEDMKKQGFSEVEIARGLGLTTKQLREAKSIAKNYQRAADIARATQLRDKGVGMSEIGRLMGRNESSIRSMLADGNKEKLDILTNTANMLRDEVDTGAYIDIGAGQSNRMGISKEKLSSAVAILKDEGYTTENVQVQQQGTKNKTTIKVLAPPGTTYLDIKNNLDNIRLTNEVSNDGGRTFFGLLPPKSVDSSRIAIRYAEEGGADADGVIYVRRGVEDLSLGGSKYAQVRIAVDGTHYLKGMALYKDDLPDGVDLMFNTNKSFKEGSTKLDVMKPMKVDSEGKIDKDNPFGSSISRQIGDTDDAGRVTKLRSAMNIVNEEGDWDGWRKSIASQVLSKQSPQLAKEQLDLAYKIRKDELDEIMSLTNPAVKSRLLQAYADSADSSAVHLKAAALPRQRAQVIIPINSLKDTEIYAPNFRNGERVALVRYPHGGKFEIPELVVNNSNKEGKASLLQAKDAVGINSKVAQRLSGADFDGDSVVVIPNNSGKIRSEPALASLKNFDPQRAYPAYEGMKPMSSHTKQREMGEISNLITDMSIKGANNAEIARAVRHSMVVIDAEKHNLNYKLSAQQNGIAQLKEKYQARIDETGKKRSGASTLISQASSRIDVPDRKPRSYRQGGPIDPATGKKVFEDKPGNVYVDAKGKTRVRTIRSQKLAETDDAHSLSSGTPIEKIYADHSNRMKALGNQARKELYKTPGVKRNPSAAKTYKKEVDSLSSKLNIALKNAPLERRAQVFANSVVEAKRRANPNMDDEQLKRTRNQALESSRARFNARKVPIVIEKEEWEAIQAGAISNSRLKSILDNADLEVVKRLATPRTQLLMSPAKTRRAESLAAAGYTQSEIADFLGVSLTTLKEGLKNG